MTFKNRTTAVLAALVLLAAPLAGCGGKDEAKKPASASAAEGEVINSEKFAAAAAAAVEKQRSARMVVSVGAEMSATAEVDYSAKLPAMRMTIDVGGRKIRVVMVDGSVYIREAGGTGYLTIDESATGFKALIDQFASLGPKDSIRDLSRSVTKVVRVGQEEVDGLSLTKYLLTAKTASLTQGLGAAAGLVDLPKTITYAMFLDKSDLLRRIEMDLGGRAMVMEVSDWGKPVTIKAPADSELLKS